jgi:predicted nucleic acid-binding protein
MRIAVGCVAARLNFCMAAIPLRLAGDTNLLLDLAVGDEAVLDAIAVIDQRVAQSDWLVSPSVLEGLAFLNESGDTPKLRQSARIAFQQLQSGLRFRAMLELPFPADFIRRIASEIRQRQLVPAAELHDSFILAEAALMECAILLTSDAHLRGVDHELLTLVLNPFDLTPPVIATPREIVRKFFR